MDIGVTAVDLAGGSTLPQTDGHSLRSLLQGQEDPLRPGETVSEMRTGAGEPASRMLRRGPWKLYKFHDDTPPVLFNLTDDPAELNDLGEDSAYAAVREELMVRLYADWDPEYVERRSGELERDGALITAWGKAVLPQHPDALPVPDVEEVVRC